MKSFISSSLAVLSVLSLLGCSTGGESDASTTSTTAAGDATTTTVGGPTRIAVTVGTDSGAERTESVSLGSSVEVTLTNPAAADNFHLHGYDIETGEVEAGMPATISFTADKAGTFDIESHVTDDVLVVIEVG